MNNSYRFFSNTDCKFYPCHKNIKNMNCLFCFCPLYTLQNCPGNPEYITTINGTIIKDCSNCTFPHQAENYDIIIEELTV